MTPERRMAESLQIDQAKLESLRKAGVGMVLAAPNSGIIKGQSCVLSTADVPLNEALHRSDVFQHIRLYPIRGSGREYRQLAALAATGRTFIIPVDFPNAPKVNTEGDVLDTTLQTLMHWRLAPENPARLEQAEVDFVLTTDGLAKPTELLSKLRTAIAAGLSQRKTLSALTSEPAQLLGVETLVGTLEVGKLANILVTDGPLFAKGTNIEETWVQGRRNRSKSKS